MVSLVIKKPNFQKSINIESNWTESKLTTINLKYYIIDI